MHAAPQFLGGQQVAAQRFVHKDMVKIGDVWFHVIWASSPICSSTPAMMARLASAHFVLCSPSCIITTKLQPLTKKHIITPALSQSIWHSDNIFGNSSWIWNPLLFISFFTTYRVTLFCPYKELEVDFMLSDKWVIILPNTFEQFQHNFKISHLKHSNFLLLKQNQLLISLQLVV